MTATTILSDNGVASGSSGYKLDGGNDGTLQLRTTTTGGTPTTAVTIDNSQVVTFAQAPVLPAGSITQAAIATNVAGKGPAFSVYSTSNTVISSATNTKVPFNTKVFDTNTNFDVATNYRFTPTVAGYYQLNAGIYLYSTAASVRSLKLYKNGSFYQSGNLAVTSPSAETVLMYSGLVYLNGSTDYVEMYVYDNGTSPTIYGTSSSTNVWFSGSLARAA